MHLTIRPYQYEWLDFLKKWNGRALLGDVPGTGKTLEALLWLRDPLHLPAIIVCPSGIKEQWALEWKKWGLTAPIYIARGETPKGPRGGRKNLTYIISWDVLIYWLDYLPKMARTIVADECQEICNMHSQRTRALSWLTKFIPYFIPMSGTPILSKPGQFYPVLHMLDPENFNSQKVFQARYCKLRRNRWSGKIEEAPGGKNLSELHFILKDYMIRREKCDVLKDMPRELPPIIVLLETQQQQEYKKLETEVRRHLDESNGEMRLLHLKNSAFGFKKEAIVEWITNFLDSGESLIVFAYHRLVMSYLEKHFRDRCVRVDGSVIGKQRDSAIALFKAGKRQLLIGQIEAIGIGVDGLQDVCSDCAFAEFGRRAVDHDQAESRLKRSGQTKFVNCYYLVGKDLTIDLDCMENLDVQRTMYDQLVRGKATSDDNFLVGVYNKWRGEH